MALTNIQQSVLVKEIHAAMESQGVSQRELALRGACTSPGNLSSCLACNSRMSETKWRGACEMLGIDYDAIIGSTGNVCTWEDSEQTTNRSSDCARPVISAITLGVLLSITGDKQPASLHIVGEELRCSVGIMKAVLSKNVLERKVMAVKCEENRLVIDIEEELL